MGGLNRAHERMTRLIATLAALIVAIGLVSAPNRAGAAIDPAIPRHTAAAIQLQALSAAITPTPPFAAATPSANASLPTPQSLFDAVVAIALTPLWYVAFPVTLPGSIAFAWVLGFVASGIGGWQTPIDTAAVLKLGLEIFFLGPLTHVSDTLSALVPNTNSASATAKSILVSAPSTTSAAPREGLRATSGLAGPLRTANASTNADRAPTVHRAAETTAAPIKKTRTGTAGSGRH
jgi:hypothetical protein